MSSQSAQDKTEKASAQKIKKARQEGQIPRAKDLTTSLLFLSVMLYFYYQLDHIASQVMTIFQFNLALTNADLADPWIAIEHLGHSLGLFIQLLLPLFAIILIMVISSSMILGGWLFYLPGIFPKLSKLNPLTGIKRMFSTHSLVELLKSSLKVMVILTLIYWYLETHLTTLLSMQELSLKDGIVVILHILFDGVMLMGGALLIFGLMDLPYQRWEHMNQLKMTKQEQKEEYKNNEGRPEVKQRIRQIQHQFARRKIEKTVPNADVVIINPTHYAVAIKYDPHIYDAPFVMAKGIDEIAMHIRRIAKEHQVEIVSVPPLTRSIYHTTQIEQAVPNQLYVAVAHVLAYVLQLKAYKTGRGLQPQPMPAVVIPDNLQY